MIKKLYGEPACMVEDSLVIADLHIGMENEYSARGISVPSMLEEMEDRVLELLDVSMASRVVILGDLKHSIPWAGWEEYSKLPQAIEKIRERAEVVLVKGNHDSLIERLLDVEVTSELEIGGVKLLHGHRVLEEASDYILMAHSHPAIVFHDSLGVTREKAWIEAELSLKGREHYGQNSKVVVMPAFSPLITGTGFNVQEAPLGPMFNRSLVELGSARAYLLDSTWLGELRDLVAPPQEGH